jgi:predicted transcriptional regulator
MNTKKHIVTAKELVLMEILRESDEMLPSSVITEMYEDGDDYNNVKDGLYKLQKKGFVGKKRESTHFLFFLTSKGISVLNDVDSGKIKVTYNGCVDNWLSFGTCTSCGKEKCKRTKIKNEKLCRDCLIDDHPMTLEEYIDGRQHSSIHEFSIFPVHKRKYFQPKKESKP